MVSKRLGPSAHIYAPGAPGNGGLAGRVPDPLTADPSATQGMAACRQGSLYSWSMRAGARTGFPGASVLSHKRPSGSREARMTQQSLGVIMEKASLSLGHLLAGFVALDKNNRYPDGGYITGESACVTERWIRKEWEHGGK